MINLIHGDCLDVLPGIADQSINLILCDLPYGSTTCAWDSVIPLEPLWQEYMRIIKPNCPIVLTANQPFASVLITSNLSWFKYDWVWLKGRGSNFQIAKYKPMVSHEHILVFGKNRITYNPQMRPRETPRLMKNNGRTRTMKVSNGKKYIADKPLTERYPITELYYPNNNQRAKIHPTQKPVALFEYLIRTYSNDGDVILDNCLGSGTTIVAAINVGNRSCIGIEKDLYYYTVSKERIDSENSNKK